jgi:uncharacterized protein (DUF1810 family)
MTASLDRFLLAQDGPAGFEQALAELRSGGKRSHWIWYIFPQIAGLGSSPMAEAYGVRGAEEAAAYLAHPVLRRRLLSAMDAVRAQTAPLGTVMGSQIDVLKLVSSMTLFHTVAQRVNDAEIAASAEALLARAGELGIPECAFTQRALSSSL